MSQHQGAAVSAAAECLSKITLSTAQIRHNPCLFPLLGDGVAEPGYRLLDAALTQGCARGSPAATSGSPSARSAVIGGWSWLRPVGVPRSKI